MIDWINYETKKPKNPGRYLVAYKHISNDKPWYEVLEYRRITRLDKWELPDCIGQTIFVDYNDEMTMINMDDHVEFWAEINDPKWDVNLPTNLLY